MIKKHLQRWGTLCLVALAAFVARAQQPNIQEKELYATDFTEWGAYETNAKETETNVTWDTKYSHETLTFSIFNTQIGASNFNVGKFPDWTGGMLMAAKSDNPYIITSPLASITRVRFMHAATGSNRGWKLWAKGEGDADWVLISDEVALQTGSVVEKTIDKTNCQLKFTNITNNQNAYLMELAIYGNVDLSKSPMLGTFSFNGETYEAGETFKEVSPNVNETTVEVSNSVELPSASNPVTVTVDNGQLDGDVTYTPQADGSVVASIKVVAGGTVATYNIIFRHKPYFTITYYNTDGSVLDATQKVEKDGKIGTLRGYDGVTVPEGYVMRGWFVSAVGGQKYTADDVVTADIDLYALVTAEEKGSTTARYDYDLTDKYFYDEDHEAFNAAGGDTGYHDGTHGWVLKAKDGNKIDLLVEGNAYIILGLCNQSKGNLTLSDAGDWSEDIAGKASSDGQAYVVDYNAGQAGTLTLTATDGDVYIHSIAIANYDDAPVEANGQGYYMVRPGDGDNFRIVLEVVNSLPASEGRAYIYLPDGTYDLGDRVLTPITRNEVSIIGQSMDNTVIVNEAPVEGISVSATFLVKANDTYFQDLTLKNAYDYYGIAGSAGRAVVLQDKGDRTICKNVRMLSYQDTYYSNNNGHYYFEDSDIHGTVDFICGSGDAFFKNCTLTVEKRSADGSGECTITAPSTDVAGGNKWGYVFDGCTVNCIAEAFNYGRAWNDSPRCAYLNTVLLQPEKINPNRWTLDGMNVVADRFVEYNTKDASGKVVSPASWSLVFKKNSDVNEMETILTDDQAAEYSVDNVFIDWTPDDHAAQKELGLLKADGTTLSWDAVAGAKAYAVFRDGKFVDMTTENAYTMDGGEADKYTVRAANEYGGFGRAASTSYTSGVDSVDAGISGDVVRTAYYSVQGSRVSDDYKGIVIKVDTMGDGSVKACKVIK